MSKSKQIILMILCVSSFQQTKAEYGYPNGQYDYHGNTWSSNTQDGHWLSNILGTAAGLLGLSQSTNNHQNNYPLYAQYNDRDQQPIIHDRADCTYPSWNEYEMRKNINKQRESLRKTNIAYKKQRYAIARKHKSRIHKRFKAIKRFFDGNKRCGIKSYTIFPDARRLLNKYVDAVPFEKCYGHEVQQIMHREFVDMVNVLPRAKNADELAKYIAPCADAGIACNKAGYVTYAFYFADFCWATVEGVGQGAYNTAQAFCHPIDTTVCMAQGVLFLGKLLGKVGKEALDMTTLAFCDEQDYVVQRNNRLKQAIVVCDGVAETIKKNPRDAYKNTISFGTEWFLFGKCLSSLGRFSQYMKPKLQNAFEKLAAGRRRQVAFAGMPGAELSLMEVLIDELGNVLHRSQESLQNTGSRIRKWMPNCSGIRAHMQELESIIPQLERMYDGRRVTIGHLENIRLKFNFKHVFGVELKNVRGQTRLNGFHFDPLGALEKSGVIELVNVQHGPQGFYKALVKIGDQILRPEKTFFPKHWDHFKIMENVTEALRDAVIHESYNNGTYLIKGCTKSGIEIRAYLNEAGTVASWYPYLGVM